MLVGRGEFDRVLGMLKSAPTLAVDTETSGLRPYHGDRLFSLVLATRPTRRFYFNWHPYAEMDPEGILLPRHLERLKLELFNTPRKYYAHNAKYDMAILDNEGIELRGIIHCTKAMARVEYNEHRNYDLESCLDRIGLRKDSAVSDWIDAFPEITQEKIHFEGKAKTETLKKFWTVPILLIGPYGEQDAGGCFALGRSQEESIHAQSKQTPEGLPPLHRVLDNERRLTQTVFDMERRGVLIDLPYAVRAAQFEGQVIERARTSYREATGESFTASAKAFAKHFDSEKAKWQYTEKGNPSFTSDVLETFTHPAARFALEIRGAKSRQDFYTGFSYHADRRGYVHSTLNPDGAAHGRTSSSNPNFQNLKADEDEGLKAEFVVRRAVIPPPGFSILSLDFSSMEFRAMLDQAARMVGRTTPLVREVQAGKDVHQATADLAHITRGQAKTTNFLTLYGGGNAKLAAGLKISEDAAREIREAIFGAAPEIKGLIRTMMKAAETRGYVRNWMGRRCYFPDRTFAYIAPNYLIAGGCADVVKVAMNRIDDFLKPFRTKLVLMVHDELVFYLAQGEEHLIPEIKRIMETVYPAVYLPLVCSAYTSTRSLADLEPWNAG